MSELNSSKLKKGFLWKFLHSISTQGVTFLLSVLLARILTPADYGVVAIVYVFITFANVIVVDGFSSALIQKKNADARDFSSLFWGSMGVASILYILLFISADLISGFFNQPLLSEVLRVYSLCLFLNAFLAVQVAFLSKELDFKKQFTSSAVGAIVGGVLGIAAAYAGFGVWSIVIQQLSGTMFNIIVLLKILPWHPEMYFSLSRCKSLMSYGGRITEANLIRTITNEVRQLLIAHYYLPADLALYNRGMSFPGLFYTNISNTVSTVLFPAMSNINGNFEELKRLTRKSIQLNSFFMCLFLGWLFSISKPLVILLLTEKWVGCVPFLQMACVSNVFAIISLVNLQAIKALGQSKDYLRLEIIKMPVFLLLLVVSLNISLYAVAITLPIYSLIASGINALPTKKFLKYSYKEQVWDLCPSLIIAMIGCGIVSIIECSLLIDNIWEQAVIATVIYLSVYIFSNALIKSVGFKFTYEKIKGAFC